MADLVHTERHGDVAVVRMANPPVNALSSAMRLALHGAVAAAGDDPSAAAIVIVGDGRCFSGGADIAEFQSSPDAGFGQGVDLNDLSAQFDDCAKPVVVALHGVAFGGGLEIALGAQGRVAAPGALLGLPEVKIGLLPGAGGTQRLPRLIGLEAAAAMILSGEPVDAVRAEALGLVDVVAPTAAELLPAACAHAMSLVGRTARRVRDLQLPAWSAHQAALLAAARAAMPQARQHARNGDEIVACLRAAVDMPFDDGVVFERERFLACNASPQAAALQHVFFAQREAAKVAGVPRGTAERPVKTVGLVSRGDGAWAGSEGAAVAGAVAVAVAVADGADASSGVSDFNGGNGVTGVGAGDAGDAGDAGGAAGRRARGTVDAANGLAARFERAGLAVRMLGADADDAALAACDLVVAVDDAGVADAMAIRLGAACRPGTVLALATVGPALESFARATGRQGDVVGLHMVADTPSMRVMEVRPVPETLPETLATVLAVARRLDRLAVVVRGAGGIAAPMRAAYGLATRSLLQRGVAPATIDGALVAFGMAVGPCAALGLTGESAALDGRGAVSRTADAATAHAPAPGTATATAATAVTAVPAQAHPPTIDAAAIAAHCLAPLAGVGAALLRDGVAARASDIDMVWVFGGGYPAERGGPMYVAAIAASA